MTQASTHELQSTIELAWESRASINATNSPEIYQAVEAVIGDLNAGRLRVAERLGLGQWSVNQWVKKAVLLSFRLNDNKTMRAGDLGFFDKDGGAPPSGDHPCRAAGQAILGQRSLHCHRALYVRRGAVLSARRL